MAEKSSTINSLGNPVVVGVILALVSVFLLMALVPQSAWVKISMILFK